MREWVDMKTTDDIMTELARRILTTPVMASPSKSYIKELFREVLNAHIAGRLSTSNSLAKLSKLVPPDHFNHFNSPFPTVKRPDTADKLAIIDSAKKFYIT